MKTAAVILTLLSSPYEAVQFLPPPGGPRVYMPIPEPMRPYPGYQQPRYPNDCRGDYCYQQFRGYGGQDRSPRYDQWGRPLR